MGNRDEVEDGQTDSKSSLGVDVGEVDGRSDSKSSPGDRLGSGDGQIDSNSLSSIIGVQNRHKICENSHSFGS